MVAWTRAYWSEQMVEKSLRTYNVAFRPGAAAPVPRNLRKILICAYHGLGNFLMYTPALRAFRQYFADAQIDLQVGNRTGCEQVLEGSGYFHQVYDMCAKANWKYWREHIRHIRAEGYDLLINEFHSNSQHLAAMVSFSGAPYRLGHVRSPGWPDRYGFIYNLPVTMAEDQHEIDRYFALARKLGIPEASFNRKTFLALETSHREWARQFLRGMGIPAEALVVGVQMGTSPNMRWKQWSPQKFRQLCEQILATYPTAALLMLGSPNEAPMITEAMRGLSERIVYAVGETTVKQVAALVKSCHLLLCNDSGLMHVAVAVDTPVVAIYGPTDYRRTAPLGPLHTMINKHVPCSPCFRMDGPEKVLTCPHHNCLTTMEVAEVLAAVRSQLGLRTED